MPVLIYCANAARRCDEIALAAGYRLGRRLPGTVYFRLYFADQDYRRPNRMTYMHALAEHRPSVATVLDWEREEQLSEVLDWAEEASQYVERVVIVPKVMGGIPRLPRRIGGREVVLGYSVPTRYGGTSVPVWEWGGRQIHLLGGSPHAQMHVYSHLATIAEVVSADGNMFHLKAFAWNRYWMPGNARCSDNRWWPRLDESDGKSWGKDASYEAFRRSCINIIAAWKRLAGE